MAENSHLPRCTLLLVTTLDKVHAGSASGTAAQSKVPSIGPVLNPMSTNGLFFSVSTTSGTPTWRPTVAVGASLLAFRDRP